MGTAVLNMNAQYFDIACNALSKGFLETFSKDNDYMNAVDTLVINYRYNEREDVTLTFNLTAEDMVHFHYHLNEFTLSPTAHKTEDFYHDIDFVARLTTKVSDYFDIIGNDKESVRMRKWLKQTAGGNGQITNGKFLSTMYLVSNALIVFFPECFTCTVKKNGSVSMTPVFGFKRILNETSEKKCNEYRIKRMYDGWDCVRMTEDEYNKACEYVSDFRRPSIQALALERFCIAIKVNSRDYPHDQTQVIYYDLNPKTGFMKIIMQSEESPVVPIEFYTVIREKANAETGNISAEYTLIGSSDKEQEAWAHSPICDGSDTTNFDGFMETFFDINKFLLYYGSVSMDVKEIECKPSKGERKSGSRPERTTTRLFKSYTLKKDWKAKANRKKATFTCLAWGVRGHWRHYKNGKTVFINSYVKGKERDKYVGKDYVLFPKSKEEGA